MEAILNATHKTSSFLDYVIANNEVIDEEIHGRYKEQNASIVECDLDRLEGASFELIVANLMLVQGQRVRHDSDALAKILVSLGASSIDRKIASAKTKIFGRNQKLDL